MRSLHPLQQQLLDLLRGVSDQGYTYKEMMDQIGASSTSQVHHHLQQLERKGFLKRDPDDPRLFRVIKKAESEFDFLPLRALASCGPGIENEHLPIESIPVRSSMIPTKIENSYLVRAEGDSLEPKIHNRDMVLVEDFVEGRHHPNGKIVVCTYKGETRMKKYTKLGNHVVLESFNQKYPPVVIEEPDEFQINGIVRGVLFSSL